MHERSMSWAAVEAARAGEQGREQAVEQMDRMTQQNAALVEDSAASARLLEDQAKALHAAIGVFNLRGTA